MGSLTVFPCPTGHSLADSPFTLTEWVTLPVPEVDFGTTPSCHWISNIRGRRVTSAKGLTVEGPDRLRYGRLRFRSRRTLSPATPPRTLVLWVKERPQGRKVSKTVSHSGSEASKTVVLGLPVPRVTRTGQSKGVIRSSKCPRVRRGRTEV